MTPARLARLLRVRTLQLGLVRADEARAQQRLAGERALSQRIVQLSEAVAPATLPGKGFSLVAAAHLRDRLQQSAEAAAGRMRAAEQVTQRASAATLDARRDQSAIEKLIVRADADAAIAAIRALETGPSAPRQRSGR